MNKALNNYQCCIIYLFTYDVQAYKAFQKKCHTLAVIHLIPHFLIILIKEVLTGLLAGYCYQRHLQAVSLACCIPGAYQQTRNDFFFPWLANFSIKRNVTSMFIHRYIAIVSLIMYDYTVNHVDKSKYSARRCAC